MSGRQRVKTVVRLEERKEALAPKAPSPAEVDPLYGVALLKVAFELKRRPEGTVDEVLSAVLARMRLPEAEFRAYLEQQGGLLATLGPKR
ncbi:hypothetical protein DRW03_03745 [Corallococcus sp. H22C18031201]|uniref:hypothetical protein n=1 Tax=Citreicoccus inhibens TaxID=2849499 RepID=UPI000E767692|nr:hypothetical protein [Citreicoccus inhibens]MBJ6764793.1 hypothetical protein [Myxococcaceae bacterium JPH2]MBU8897712.1 hypothetical protein [Citreicoccus inhibens]RJS27482.1 hypothetical protein DRW03_03745 [Corallococcus sp. H22C18031201]